MNHFFLLNEAIDLPDFEAFKSGMEELIKIEKEDPDVFLKHESLYLLNSIKDNLYQHFGHTEMGIMMFIEQMQNSATYLADENAFDSLYPNSENAFLGIDFSSTTINAQKQITNSISYQSFKQDIIWDFSFRTFWEKRESIFPNLIFCGVVEEQIANIGESSIFNQIIGKLKELDKVAEIWTTGEFNYKKVVRDYPLRISPESEQTLSRFSGERTFSLPSGRREVFDLHIKTGNLRFHFYPDNEDKKIYIGYIGPHLRTKSN